MDILRDINGKEIKIGDYVLRHLWEGAQVHDANKKRLVSKVMRYESDIKCFATDKSNRINVRNSADEYEVITEDKAKEIENNSICALVDLIYARNGGLWCKMVQIDIEIPEDMQDYCEADEYHEMEMSLIETVDLLDEVRTNPNALLSDDLNTIYIDEVTYKFIPFANRKEK